MSPHQYPVTPAPWGLISPSRAQTPQDKLDAVLSKRFAVHPILDCDIDSVTSPLEPAVKRGRFGPALPDLRDEIKVLA